MGWELRRIWIGWRLLSSRRSCTVKRNSCTSTSIKTLPYIISTKWTTISKPTPNVSLPFPLWTSPISPPHIRSTSKQWSCCHSWAWMLVCMREWCWMRVSTMTRYNYLYDMYIMIFLSSRWWFWCTHSDNLLPSPAVSNHRHSQEYNPTWCTCHEVLMWCRSNQVLRRIIILGSTTRCWWFRQVGHHRWTTLNALAFESGSSFILFTPSPLYTLARGEILSVGIPSSSRLILSRHDDFGWCQVESRY